MDMQYCAQANYGPVFNFTHGQGEPMHYPENPYSPMYPGYHGLQYMYSPQQGRNQLMPQRDLLGEGKTESKPRLSKEEVEKLEKVFQENPKPSSSVKAQLADGLGLERPRINNWFQNRRARAKQERKQEEYEARRAVEKAASAANSPEDAQSGVSDMGDDSTHQRMKPSSAPFPALVSATPTLATEDADNGLDDEDATAESDSLDSPFVLVPPSVKVQQDGFSPDFQSPLSSDFAPADEAFAYSRGDFNHHQQPVHDFASFQNQAQQIEDIGVDGLPHSEEHMSEQQADNFLKFPETGFSNPSLPYFQTTVMDECSPQETAIEASHTPDGGCHSPLKTEQTPPHTQAMLSPVDSFKSPPPPANIASRRNIPRPAALNAASLRSRSYNISGGPKTAVDGVRRADPSSPVTAMRRIASSSGSMTGRIQKPRSPMILNRSTEARLQYHARSPVGTMNVPFGGTAPPTPMTPAVMSQQGLREPTVSSSCSDDEALMLSHGLSTNTMHEIRFDSLKTPPGTPGLIGNFGSHNYGAPPLSAGLDYQTDRPLWTPYFQTEFSDLSMPNVSGVPSYVDISDSLPTTPLYPNMPDSNGFVSGPVVGNQYDWDANESITSCKSSPGQPRCRQIQFIQNITPQDYTEK